ncbi:MAG: kynureninase [Paracoccaceae bacterium]|jgi:kynureninase
MTDFDATRARFSLPDGVIYLDGNSLGPLPVGAAERVARMMTDEWGALLIRGWNDAGWMQAPARIGDRIARLIGAAPGTVTVGDTLSIRVWQALASALDLMPERRVILSDSGNFPSDLYMADGLAQLKSLGHELRVVAPEDVADAIDDTVAAVMLTEVDYRTGRIHDMAGLTARAHAAGALTVWDLAHSAGAIAVDLAGAGADFAVGCTYKYLNGGPGSPAFIYVAPHMAARARNPLQGWLGHASPFEFARDYTPAPGVAGMRIGTPPVIALAALDAALDAWEGVEMANLRARSIALSEAFIAGIEALGAGLILASPRDPLARGSQVSFRHEHSYAICRALIARGVIGDFRAPDVIRFGFAPLYVSPGDVAHAVDILGDIMATRAWDRPEFHARTAVT